MTLLGNSLGMLRGCKVLPCRAARSLANRNPALAGPTGIGQLAGESLGEGTDPMEARARLGLKGSSAYLLARSHSSHSPCSPVRSPGTSGEEGTEQIWLCDRHTENSTKETPAAPSITQGGRNKANEWLKDLKSPSVQLPEQQVTNEKRNHQKQTILILHLQK